MTSLQHPLINSLVLPLLAMTNVNRKDAGRNAKSHVLWSEWVNIHFLKKYFKRLCDIQKHICTCNSYIGLDKLQSN